jgi:hypothetical protein
MQVFVAYSVNDDVEIIGVFRDRERAIQAVLDDAELELDRPEEAAELATALRVGGYAKFSPGDADTEWGIMTESVC